MITNKVCRITYSSFLIIELTLKTSNNFSEVVKKIIFSYTFASSGEYYNTPLLDCGICIPIILPTDKNLGQMSGAVSDILRRHFSKLIDRKLKRYDDIKERKQIRYFYDAAKESIQAECTVSNNLTLLHRALSWPEKIVKEYYDELANLL